MGNSCCPPSNPCDHTVDETKGLLSSSESKNSTKAEGIEEVSFNPPEVAEESKNVEEPEKEVVTDQPAVDHKAQSSYSDMMNTLHTEVSLAAQASQSSSLEASHEQVESAIEIPETNKDCRIQNVRTSDDALPDSVKAPEEMVTAEETSETKAQITNVENLDKSAVTALVEQEGPADTKAHLEISEKDIKEEASEVEVQREVADMGVQKNAAEVKVKEEAAEVEVQEEASEVEVQEEASEVEVQEEAAERAVQKEAADVVGQKEASVMDIQNKAAKMEVQMQVTTLEVQKEAAVMEVQKEAPEEEVQKSAAKMEVPMEAADVDVEKVADHVDEEQEAAEDDLQRKAAELDINKEQAEVDVPKNISEEKPKAPVDVLIEKDSTETKRQALNEPTTEKHAVEHQFTMEISQNSNKADPTVTENGEAKSSSELDVVKNHVPTKAITEEPVGEPADKVEDRFVEDIVSDTGEEKEDDLLSETQEHSGVLTSPADKISSEVTPHTIENGQRDDLKDKNPPNVHVALVPEMPQETEQVQKTLEESSCIECKAQQEQETSANMSSTVQEVEKSEDAAADQELSAEYLLNGLDSSTPVEKTEYKDAHGDTVQVENVEPEREALLPNDGIREDEEPELQLSEKEKTTLQEPVEKEDAESLKGHQGEIIVSSSHAVEVALIPVSETFLEEEEQQQGDEDLYLGAEEIEEKRHKEKQSKPLLEFTIPGVEERCSLAAAVDILAYSEREWKGNTAKSTLIRKGYSEMSCSFSGLRRVRGDNYCALRATLFQVLATSTQTPDWLQEEDFTSLPEKLEAQEHLIHGWKFPEECRKVGEKENAVEKLKHYMQLLQKRWQAAADSVSLEERQRLCECVFQSGEEEYGLLEVLKFLMLARAVELHYQMQAGQEVPVFCWLLFARDTSENPQTLLNNHLSQIGFSGGLEQVEMFLLGYALQHTIQTFRLYKMDTEEFVTHYPDDHKQDWPCVCIVTEDDRHYNVPIRKRAQHQLNPDFSVPWPDLS